jgi:uncharacterized protein (DUF952 family)
MKPHLKKRGSLLDQALKVAETHFSHEEDVLLLTIDPSLVKAEIKYELASNGQEYPHVYGVSNFEAIVGVVPFLKKREIFYYQRDKVKSVIGI